MTIYEEQETRLTDSPIVENAHHKRIRVQSERPTKQPLAHDERIIRTVRPHWSGILPGVFFLIGLFAIPFALQALDRPQWAFIAVLVLMVAEPIGLAALLHARRANSLVITNKRLICSHGFFEHVHRGVPIGHITNVSSHHDVLQRLLGTGTVEVDISGQYGPEVFPNIPEPDEVAELLIEEIEDFESAMSQAPPPATPSPATTTTEHSPARPTGVIDEIERLHHLLSSGAITQEEYEHAKTSLFRQL
jgi:membrane protein YdbS with pleckstrin-like domain